MYADNITIRDAAELCGLNYGSWSNWERGKKPRDLLEVVSAISGALGVNRTWLLLGGPLARAEENRDLWRPQVATIDVSDTARYPRSAGRRAVLTTLRSPDRMMLTSAA
jgi:transcriptional regulator with XRE-family HTH domain